MGLSNSTIDREALDARGPAPYSLLMHPVKIPNCTCGNEGCAKRAARNLTPFCQIPRMHGPVAEPKPFVERPFRGAGHGYSGHR